MRKEKTAPLPKRALPDALALCRQNFPDSGTALSPEGEGSVCPISLRRTDGAGGGLQADPVFWALDKGTAYRCRVLRGESHLCLLFMEKESRGKDIGGTLLKEMACFARKRAQPL